jgi:hypothetical protein
MLKRYWFALFDPVTRRQVGEPVCSTSTQGRIHRERQSKSDGQYLTVDFEDEAASIADPAPPIPRPR